MAKFTIRSNDLKEYNRLMRNAKNKMRRLQKEGIDLTGEIELPPLAAFDSRKQFNEWKEFTEKFNKGLKREYKVRTTKEGGKLLQKEIDEYVKSQEKAIHLAEERYKERTPESGRIFGKPKKNVDIPDRMDWKELSRERFLRRKEWLNERSKGTFFTQRDITFRDNFKRSVEGSFDSFWMSNEVVEMIDRMNPKDLAQLMGHKDYEEYFNFEIYDSEGQQIGANLNHLEALHTILKAVDDKGLEGLNEDFLLKNFPDKV